jgi:radical SAM superfamily enzyme YgiQ (UPF0313 family)
MASVLIQDGLDVLIHDLEVESISPSELLREIRDEHVVLLGLSCVTVSLKNACRIAALVKRSSPDTLVIIGGPHVTYMIADSLQFAGIDAVAYGEGENIIRDLCRNLLDNRPWQDTRGIALRTDDGRIHVNPPHDIIEDLDSLPFPALYLLELDRYLSPGILMTARGCPFKCQFCSESMAGYGPKIRRGYRLRSIDNVMAEVENFIHLYGVTSFFFADDTFTINKRRTLELCAALTDLKRQGGLGEKMSFTCESRADIVTEELIQAMSEAGCAGIQFGLESGSQVILDTISKGTKVDQYREAVRWCSKYGVKTTLSFMFPNPGDTAETVAETKAFLGELYELGASSFIPSLTTPYPGTELFQRHADLGIKILTDDWDLYNCNTPIITTNNFDLLQIREVYDELVGICQEYNINRIQGTAVMTDDVLNSLERVGMDRTAIVRFQKIGQITRRFTNATR